MTGIICYIERAERGCLPLRLRLVSPRQEDAWSFPDLSGDDAAALARSLDEGAGWIESRLRELGAGGLDALVLDADGAFCSWVSAPNADPEAIGAMLRHASQSGVEDDPSHAIGSPPHLTLDPDVQAPGATSFQPLGAEDQGAARAGGLALRKKPAESGQPRRRMGVMAIADASVRLLIDALDQRGIGVAHTTTVWHALAGAFDRSGGLQQGERVVAESGGETRAWVALDAGSGRLLWSWSRAGTLVASGAFRVARAPGEAAGPVLRRADLARLASEWIAWATQLGASPSRVRVVLTEGAWQEETSLGEEIGRVWPGATADITFDGDPVGLVLSRYAEWAGGPAAAGADVVSLQNRPGREHRGMYRWGALAIGAAAVTMAVGGFLIEEYAASARVKAGEQRSEWRAAAKRWMPNAPEDAAFDGILILDMRAELDRRKQALAPVRSGSERPVLQELETLSLVLGSPDYRLERLDIRPLGVYIDISVPDTAAYEALSESLNRIAGSSVASWKRSASAGSGRQAGRLRCTFEGVWSEQGARTVSRAGGSS